MPILTSEERIGTLLAEKYRIDRIIGKGGMGVVFAAEHTWTGRTVAVKIIHPTLAEDEVLAQRLLREARTAASLNHPNAVQVLDMGADADGTVYLVLELLKGESLDARLSRQGRLPFAETLAVMLPVMNALVSAHEAGLVHRDLKPDNVFLHEGPTGVIPTLLDFGIAKVIQDGAAKVTQTGVVMGTPHYISPEQAVGESTVGPPADVWAMGVLLFECLTGTMPFDGKTSTKIVMKVVTEEAPKLAAMGIEPVAAAHAIDRALEKDLTKRYANMREFADALWAAAVQGGYSSVPSVGSAPVGATPSAGNTAVPLYTPADGAAPVLMLTPSGGVSSTAAMSSLPPIAAPAPQASGRSRPWAAIVGGALVALLLIGAASVGAAVMLFTGDGASDDTPPAPGASAPRAGVPVIAVPPLPPQAPAAAPVVAEPQEPAAEAPAEPVEEAVAEPTEPAEATAEEPPPETSRRGRTGTRAARRGNRPGISSSW